MLDMKKRKRTEVFSPPSLTYTIPPLNQKEFKGLVIDILAKESIKAPFDSISLLRMIKKNFRHVDYSSFVLSRLNINDVLRDLIQSKVLTCEELTVNMKRGYYVKAVDLERIKSVDDWTEINSDFEKYLEKAKSIMLDCMNERNFHYDKDDLYVNEVDVSHKKARLDSISVPVESSNELVDDDQNFINSMLYAPTAKVMMNSSHFSESDYPIISSSVLSKMQSKYASSLRPFCQFGVLKECQKASLNKKSSAQKPKCNNVHFRPIVEPHTDVSLGDCSYLDTCRHMEICKFVHYQIEDDDVHPSNRKELVLSGDAEVLDSQWVNCDIRYFDYSILGKFDVIMADPPWDIHMDLPYGTLSDEEMKSLNIKDLQDDGVIFLWVTGRATELARECLELWGYERKEELTWIKTNQLQRLIRTGRTGHWLNHSKEHCLIGFKGNPRINKNIDCDVLVSEVRETSRKPDEIYELIERMRPGGRKLELFARPHNRRQGWISLGNQLPGVYFVEEEQVERFNVSYPDAKLTKEVMDKNKENSIFKK